MRKVTVTLAFIADNDQELGRRVDRVLAACHDAAASVSEYEDASLDDEDEILGHDQAVRMRAVDYFAKADHPLYREIAEEIARGPARAAANEVEDTEEELRAHINDFYREHFDVAVVEHFGETSEEDLDIGWEAVVDAAWRDSRFGHCWLDLDFGPEILEDAGIKSWKDGDEVGEAFMKAVPRADWCRNVSGWATIVKAVGPAGGCPIIRVKFACFDDARAFVEGYVHEQSDMKEAVLDLLGQLEFTDETPAQRVVNAVFGMSPALKAEMTETLIQLAGEQDDVRDRDMRLKHWLGFKEVADIVTEGVDDDTIEEAFQLAVETLE